jgi:hypothetical protein
MGSRGEGTVPSRGPAGVKPGTWLELGFDFRRDQWKVGYARSSRIGRSCHARTFSTLLASDTLYSYSTRARDNRASCELKPKVQSPAYTVIVSGLSGLESSKSHRAMRAACPHTTPWRMPTAESLAPYIHLLERDAIMPCLISTAEPISPQWRASRLSHSPTLPRTLLTAETRLL